LVIEPAQYFLPARIAPTRSSRQTSGTARRKVCNRKISRLEICERIFPNLSVVLLSVKPAKLSMFGCCDHDADHKINVRIACIFPSSLTVLLNEPCVRAEKPYKSHGGRRYAMGAWRRTASHLLRSPRLTLKAGRNGGVRRGEVSVSGYRP
jgi:hypothetical protein